MAENNENELIEEIDQKPDENSEEAEIENSESDQQNLQEVIEQHWDKILRLQAEIENLRKRNIKDVESAAKTSIERVIQEILPVIDSFEIGMTIDTKTDEGIETFITGQKATYKQLKTQGIMTQVHYIPVTSQPFYNRKKLKNSADFYRHCLSLPIYADLNNNEQNRVINLL